MRISFVGLKKVNRLDLHGPHRWAAFLGFPIVGFGIVYPPSQAHAGIGPAPAKPMAVRCAHEIFVAESAVEPEIVAFQNLTPLSSLQRHPERQALARRDLRIRFKNEVWQESIDVAIIWLGRQLVSDGPSIQNLNRKCFGGSEIRKYH